MTGVLRDREDPALVGERKHKLTLLMLTVIWQEYYEILHKLPLLMLTDLAGVLRDREDPAHVGEGQH